MSNPPSGQVVNAKDLQRIADEKETEKLKEILARRNKEEDEERQARQDFMAREIRPDGIDRFNGWVRRAAEQGRSDIEILRFPSEYCTDRGRAINQQEPGWENTLTGLPKEIFEFWQKHLQSRGYKIRYQIVNFPNGMPGDIGITLSWS